MSIAYRMLHGISRFASRLFYREIKLTDRKPDTQPSAGEQATLPEGGLLVMANHSAHMNDSVVMQAVLGRTDIFYLYYSTLFKGLLLGWLYRWFPKGEVRTKLEAFEDYIRMGILRWFHFLPLHRGKDGKGDFRSRKQNFVFLEEAARMIAEGHVVVMFPDGGSPSGYQHSPVKSGAALLAMSAALEAEKRQTSASLVILGTTYENYHQPQKSAVEVQIAEVIPLGSWGSRDKRQAKLQRKRLASRIQSSLRSAITLAPEADAELISVLSYFDSEEYASVADRIKRAAAKIDYLRVHTPARWELLHTLLQRYSAETRRLQINPQGLRSQALSEEEFALVDVLSLYGLWNYAPPSSLVKWLTRRQPEHLYLRGVQVLSSYAVVMTVWTLGQSGVLLLSAQHGLIPWWFAGVSLIVNPLSGWFGAARYTSVQRRWLCWFRREELKELQRCERAILALIDEEAVLSDSGEQSEESLRNR